VTADAAFGRCYGGQAHPAIKGCVQPARVPAGVLNGLHAMPRTYRVLSLVVNILRSLPFIILLIVLIPVTSLLTGRPDDINDPRIQKLAKALNSPEVRQFILTRYKGEITPAF